MHTRRQTEQQLACQRATIDELEARLAAQGVQLAQQAEQLFLAALDLAVLEEELDWRRRAAPSVN